MIYVYALSPIDWFYGALTAEEMLARFPDEPSEAQSQRRDFVRSKEAAESYLATMEISEGWASPLYAAYLPHPDMCDLTWIFFRKEWANGTVWLVSEEGLEEFDEFSADTVLDSDV